MQDMTVREDLNVALVQAPVTRFDTQANLHNFDRLLQQVEGADLVLLPEMFNTGFSMDSAEQAEAADGPSTRWLQQQAARLGAVICGTLTIKAGEGDYRNRLVWARPDGSLEYYDKRHLFRMGGEHERFRPGNRRLLLELKGWRIRPLVCYDLRFPVWSRDAQNTDLLFYLASWPKVRRDAWNRLLPARAIENLCYVAGVNRIGEDHNGHAHSGDSQVLDFIGDSLLHVRDQEGVYQVRLSAAKLDRFKQRFPAWMDADEYSLPDAVEG